MSRIYNSIKARQPAERFFKATHNMIREVFHVYLSKFEIAVSHLFFIIFSNNKFTLVNLISRNGQSQRK